MGESEAGIFLIVNEDQLNDPSDLTEIPLKSQVINLTILWEKKKWIYMQLFEKKKERRGTLQILVIK